MSSVEATSAPTLTEAPLPNKTPFGLTRKTLPLADRRPRMLDGSEPSTRFSATESLPGWMKRTASFVPILKLCQLITTFCVLWLMTVVPAPVLMAAVPDLTTPPTGAANALAPQAMATAMASALMAKRCALPLWWVWVERSMQFMM